MDLKTSTVSIKKFDAKKQLVWGEVYVPNVFDSHGDFMTADQIEDMAHRFMAKGLVKSVDTEHDLEENGSVVVESFIVRNGDPDFIEGAWVAGVHIISAHLWDAVERGEINGFSMFGKAQKAERLLEIEVPDDGVVKGVTAKSGAPEHDHTYSLRFDSNGEFMGGEATGDTHSHRITKGTITDQGNSDHVHRFSFSEGLK